MAGMEEPTHLLRLLELQLAFGGYTVHCATDGASALALAGTIVADIVVTDVLMPNLSGTDLARRLRERPHYADVPILLYTGVNLDNADLQDALAMPLVRCVQKGAPMSAMLAVVAELTADRRVAR
jgi:CheY-like chemotaxis protein